MKTAENSNNSIYTNGGTKRFEVRVTENAQEILEAQRLRYEVFAMEMGAKLESEHLGLDRDRYDHFVKHLIVRDTSQRKIIGYTRILTRDMAFSTTIGPTTGRNRRLMAGKRFLPSWKNTSTHPLKPMTEI